MAELIQIVCIDSIDSNTYDMEWGKFGDEVLETNKIYWGEYTNPGKKIKKPAYIVYETDNDDSLIGIFDAERFITLAEWRNKQINSILDE